MAKDKEQEQEIEILEDDESNVTEDKKVSDDSSVAPDGNDDPEEQAESKESAAEEESSDEEADEDEGKKEPSQTQVKRQERKDRQKRAQERKDAQIVAQEKVIRELSERLVRVENTQTNFSMHQRDGEIKKQEELIGRIKQHLATTEDRNNHAELIDRLADEKLRLRELQTAKDTQLKNVKDGPKKNISYDEQERNRLTHKWMGKTPWFDSTGKGIDSKIALAIDEDLAQEGIFQPHTPEYFEELDARLKERLPHRYEDVKKTRKAPPSIGSTRSEAGTTTPLGKNQFLISKARKDALIEAGAWDDPVERQKYIRQYQKFDAEERAKRP